MFREYKELANFRKVKTLWENHVLSTKMSKAVSAKSLTFLLISQALKTFDRDFHNLDKTVADSPYENLENACYFTLRNRIT